MNSVLIVDDSKENIDSLRAILEDEYKVYVARSGMLALDIMQRVQPDLVLLDVMMPGMSGFDVLEEMKKDSHLETIPVIFVSGAGDLSNETKGVEYGAADYIRKPYHPEIVYLKVKNHISNKLSRDNLEHLVETRTAELIASRKAVIIGMSLLAEGRDQETGNHLQRMQQYTKIIAKYIHRMHPKMLSKEEMYSTILYAPLHDIGKVSVPDSILLKSGKLTEEEFLIIQGHTTFGSQVLKKTEKIMMSTEEKDSLRVAIEICDSHHERYDGTGYPNQLKGMQIPISARIVALADVYDALTSERTYKKAFSHEEAYRIITEGDGRTMPQHFAPEVMEAFVEMQNQFEILSKKN